MPYTMEIAQLCAKPLTNFWTEWKESQENFQYLYDHGSQSFLRFTSKRLLNSNGDRMMFVLGVVTLALYTVPLVLAVTTTSPIWAAGLLLDIVLTGASWWMYGCCGNHQADALNA